MASQKAKNHRAAYLACTITLVALAAALLARMSPVILGVIAAVGVGATLLCVMRARRAPKPVEPPVQTPTGQGGASA